MELTEGKVLHERYQVIRQLGQGGMGAVYLALDTALDHQVAVKINRNPAQDSTNQFLREAKLLAALRHPNLPRVTDYFVLEGSQFLVMDYISGDDLASRLSREGAQPVEKVLYWAVQLGGALAYLHGQKPPVTHRDIKPANIKLTPEGNVMLVDFGIAKAGDPTQMTATGAAGYTPGFAPPEQYGGAHTGPFSDQYALAATLYTLLAGQKPVDSLQRVMSNVSLTPLRTLQPSIPETVDTAIQRAMALRPEDRFSNVGEFIRALTEPSFQPTMRAMPREAAAAETVQVAAPLETVRVATPPAAKARKLPWKTLALAGGGILAAGIILVLILSLAAARRARLAESAAQPTSTILAAAPTQTSQPAVIPTQNQPATATPEPVATPVLTEVPTQIEPTVQPTTGLPPLGNGGVVAFSSNRGDQNTFQIWTMRLQLNDQGQITASDYQQLTNGAGDKTQPAWSPNGSMLLYVAPGMEASQGLDVWVMNTDGSNPVDLTQRKGDDLNPVWSPDGKLVAFDNNGRDDGVTQLFIMHPDGSNQQRLSRDFQESQPTWSPDMKYLAYVITASNYSFLYIRGRAETYQTPEPYDRYTVLGRLGLVAGPAWSPDGKNIAYTRLDGSSSQIWLVASDSGGAQLSKLTSGSHDQDAAWSPDSRWIAYTYQLGGSKAVAVMNSGGGMQTVIDDPDGEDMQPAWQPLPPTNGGQ
jgi:Tol biopolymer transport system component/predicted Ser/Thr protein kinase